MTIVDGSDRAKAESQLGAVIGSLCLAGLLAASAAALGQIADRNPVLLHKIELLPPVEAAGTGLAPEVKVRVAVDARGRVRRVSVLAVEPASELDEHFRQATVETVMRWRYAPAIVGGEPAETTLEWTVRFKPRPEDREETDAGIVEAADAEQRRARILALPVERRLELLRQHSEVAERHLDRDHRRRFESARFVVMSDAPDGGTAERLAADLEAAFDVLHDLFRPEIEPQPEATKIAVYLFAREASFAGMRSELEVFEWAAGFYSPVGFFAFHLEMPSPQSLVGAMLHEATHAYLDRHVVRPGFWLPRWLGEGFAEYMGNSEIRKGRLVPGRISKSTYMLVPRGGGGRFKTDSGWRVAEVQRAVRDGEGISVEQLITADRAVFYGERRKLFYPTSWLFVHFLRHGRRGWAAEAFPALMLYVAEGYPARLALEEAHGMASDGLEKGFRRYLEKF